VSVHNEQDAEAAPTAQAPEQVQAWSLDTDEQPQRRSWTDTCRIAALTLIGATMSGALIWVAGHALWESTSTTEPTSTPATAAAQSTDAPMPTVLPPVPDAALLDRDSRMRAIVEPQLPPKYRDGRSPETAEAICKDIAQGSSKQQEIAIFAGGSYDAPVTLDALTLMVNTAVQLYRPQVN
jgi:hypothetical protein